MADPPLTTSETIALLEHQVAELTRFSLPRQEAIDIVARRHMLDRRLVRWLLDLARRSAGRPS